MKNNPQRVRALELRLTGLTYRAVAERLSMKPEQVCQLLRAPLAVRRLLYVRSGRRCEHCKAAVFFTSQIHHRQVVGRTLENYHALDNLQYLCASCHTQTHAGTLPRKKKPQPQCNAMGCERLVVPGNLYCDSLCRNREAKRRARKVKKALKHFEAITEVVNAPTM